MTFDTISNRRSYADPFGAVYQTPRGYVRLLDVETADHMGSLLRAPFFIRAVTERLIPEAWIEVDAQPQIVSKAVATLTYPSEWGPRQFLAAAWLTIEIAKRALADGYVLKDAQAKNVVFDRARPVFVDLGSFQRYAGEFVWTARGQFDRHFLLPLLVLHHRGVLPSEFHRTNGDGLDPSTANQMLGMKAWFGLVEIETCALPARAKSSKASGTSPTRDPSVARSTYETLLNHTAALISRIRRKLDRDHLSHWGGYEDGSFHYGADNLLEKKRWIGDWLSGASLRSAIDIGANTGTFSIMAAQAGLDVVAIESDAAALDRLFSAASESGFRIAPVLMDFCAPTPAGGWGATELASFDERFGKSADIVLALAVAHHIAMRGYGYEPFMHALARLTTKHVIVEFIDPNDDMFASMLASRGLAPEPFSREHFIAAFERYFRATGGLEIKGGLRHLFRGELRG